MAKQKYSYNSTEKVMEETVIDEKVHFEQWYAIRGEQIPPQHYKEIILADFKGRKVAIESTMAEFDEALRKYGIELK